MTEVAVLVWRRGEYEKVPHVSLAIVRELQRTRGEEVGLPALCAVDEDGKVVIWPRPRPDVEVTVVTHDPNLERDRAQISMLHSIKGVE